MTRERGDVYLYLAGTVGLYFDGRDIILFVFLQILFDFLVGRILSFGFLGSFVCIFRRVFFRIIGGDRFTVSVCVNRKAMLGNFNNYRMCIGEAILDFSKERDLEDLTKTCTIARGQLMLQFQPENLLWELKQMKRMLWPPSPDIARASICVSYVNSRGFGPLDPWIEELYIVTSLSKITDVLCEITCINHHFFLAFMQPFSSEKYFRCFLDELDAAGFSYERIRSEPLRMCGI